MGAKTTKITIEPPTLDDITNLNSAIFTGIDTIENKNLFISQTHKFHTFKLWQKYDKKTKQYYLVYQNGDSKKNIEFKSLVLNSNMDFKEIENHVLSILKGMNVSQSYFGDILDRTYGMSFKLCLV